MDRTFEPEVIGWARRVLQGDMPGAVTHDAICATGVLIVDAIERTMEREPLALDALATKVKTSEGA